MSENKKILKVKDLDVSFKIRGNYLKVIDDISFDVENGDFFGVIGESGCGKSTTGKAIIKLYQPSAGSILFDDKMISPKNISKNTKKWMKKNIQMIFQDPMSSMNPIKNILSIVSEPLVVNKIVFHEALKFIKEINQAKKYFHYRFNEKNFELKSKNLSNFYLEKNNLYEDYINQIKNINCKDINNFENFLEMVSEINDELISNLFNKLNILYNLEKKQKLEIETTVKKFQTNDLEEIDLRLKKINEDVKNKEIETKNSKEYLYILKINDNLIFEKKEFIKKFKTEYSKDILSYKKEIIRKFYDDYKISKINKYYSDNKISYYLNLIQEKINKEKYLLGKQIFNKIINNNFNLILKIKNRLCNFLFLSFKEIDNIVYKINELIDSKYKDLLNECITIQKDFFSLSCDKKEKLLNDLSLLKEKIKLLFLSKKSDNNLEKFNDYVLKSQEILKNFILNIENINKKIDENKNNLKIAKRKYSSQRQVILKNKKELEKLLSEKISILMERKKIILDFKNFLLSEKPKRKQIILDNKINAKKGKYLEKLYKKEIYKEFKNIFFNLIKKENKIIKKIKFVSYSHSYFKSLKQKLSSSQSIYLAYHNIINQFKRNTHLYNMPGFLSYLFLFSLKSFLTRQRVYESLISVGLKPEHAYRYPHEFSGGQRQRIVIARSLITNPKLVIADEPISALDVSIQAQVVNIMKNLAREKGITFIFIAHDLSMVNYACNRVIIMHNGKIVEKGNVNLIFDFPIHPYTKSLLSAAPELSKIHVDLANSGENIEYYKNYNFFNRPSFFQYNNEDHYVFCTEEQFKEWTKKNLTVKKHEI